MQDIINGRCGWCKTDELYVKYHDEEWGKLVTDDRRLFEFLVLESAQPLPEQTMMVCAFTQKTPRAGTTARSWQRCRNQTEKMYQKQSQ